jgi:hypothetical protein
MKAVTKRDWGNPGSAEEKKNVLRAEQTDNFPK